MTPRFTHFRIVRSLHRLKVPYLSHPCFQCTSSRTWFRISPTSTSSTSLLNPICKTITLLRKANSFSHRRIVRNSMACTSVFFAPAVLPLVLRIGGTRTSTSDLPPSCKHTDGSPILGFVVRRSEPHSFPDVAPQDAYSAQRKEKLQNSLSVYRCHTIFNCTCLFIPSQWLPHSPQAPARAPRV